MSVLGFMSFSFTYGYLLGFDGLKGCSLLERWNYRFFFTVFLRVVLLINLPGFSKSVVSVYRVSKF